MHKEVVIDLTQVVNSFIFGVISCETSILLPLITNIFFYHTVVLFNNMSLILHFSDE